VVAAAGSNRPACVPADACVVQRWVAWVTPSRMERRGRVKAERGQKRVRGYLGGELVFDTSMPLLVWEVPYHRAYYVPDGDVVADLRPNGLTERSPSRGIAQKLDVEVPRNRRDGRSVALSRPEAR
jgi:uncharacterized protein (DUF427 family)